MIFSTERPHDYGRLSIPVLVPTHVLTNLWYVINSCQSTNSILKFTSDQVETKSPDVNLIRPDPPTLPSLLWTWLEQTFQTKLPTIPFTAAQHKHEKRLAAFIPTHPGAVGAADSSNNTMLLVHCSPVVSCLNLSCSSSQSNCSTEPSEYNLPQLVFTAVGFIY